ncbi:GGDEF domain-containing protein [Alcaligenaceae bacterium]|nr:GGDEF domain-containing protein [Alcaligenaceae bacterium]
MDQLLTEAVLNEWEQLPSRFSAPLREKLYRLAQARRRELADFFYHEMMQDKLAAQFLSHQQVKTRLHASMQHWITDLFDPGQDRNWQAVMDYQSRVGDIHARVDVPMHVVLHGARKLKAGIGSFIAGDEGFTDTERFEAQSLVNALMDLAMESMSAAYASSHDRNSRAEESYRLFSIAQNVAAEKERQRAALLNWENDLMFEQAMGHTSAQMPKIGASEFGLWFRHKGSHAFQGAPETIAIQNAMQHIDEVLLPIGGTAPMQNGAARLQHLRDLREQAKTIAFHLERLFEQHSELESGRDALTRLLSRKFLSVVMAKEVAYARRSNTRFAVLTIDIDHFKSINDQYGHEAGDMVLQQFAALINNLIRAGDYAFRLGGEEFLLLMVDTTKEAALRVAEKIRKEVEKEAFRLRQDHTLRITVSIGIALHDGHPDYMRTLRSADEALYEAKSGGRNRVMGGG